MSGRTPTTPVRADHRLMRALLKTGHKKAGVSPTPEELDRVAKVFVKAGGSWERVFKGSIDDVELIKRTLKVAVKQGYFTKAPKWG